MSFVEDYVLNAVVDWEQFDTLPTAVIEDEESKAIINHVLKDSLPEQTSISNKNIIDYIN